MKPQSYFIIGTDTHVGKTYIASALIRHFVAAGFKTIGMKPIASGCYTDAHGQQINDDVQALKAASNVQTVHNLINPYAFAPAIAPHIAAQQAGVNIQLNVIKEAYQQLSQLAEVVIVEGAGGFLVPLNDTQRLADLAVQLQLPVILVVGIRLGCINHALLTVDAIQARGLTLAGWVANQIEPDMPMFAENLDSLKQRISAPCLSVVKWQKPAKFNL
ncbi:MAG TPA: dethiobiotin synthase [Methylotenera sp.]|nr:dethiobiotin synthase [Methylotenera sp.]HPH05991.1 dethiobiotin synthase [Methylotenera sp.]HPN00569.1 dethiobiotin synthase [Methylotenera sp.]